MITAAEFIARQKALPLPRSATSKDIGHQGGHKWVIEGESYREASDYPLKVLVVQRLRLVSTFGEIERPEMGARGDHVLRIGYYIVSPKSGRWTWGQYGPFIPPADFTPLIDLARAEGTILD